MHAPFLTANFSHGKGGNLVGVSILENRASSLGIIAYGGVKLIVPVIVLLRKAQVGDIHISLIHRRDTGFREVGSSFRMNAFSSLLLFFAGPFRTRFGNLVGRRCRTVRRDIVRFGSLLGAFSVPMPTSTRTRPGRLRRILIVRFGIPLLVAIVDCRRRVAVRV